MKFQGSLVLAAICLSSINTVGAVECTQEEITKWASNKDFSSLTTSCSSYMKPGTRNNPDLLKSMCEDAKCGQGLKEIATKLPQCTVSGVSVTASIDALIEACKSGTFKIAPQTVPNSGSLSNHGNHTHDSSLGGDSNNSKDNSDPEDIKTPNPKSSPPTPTSDAAKDLIVEAATTAFVMLAMMLGI